MFNINIKKLQELAFANGSQYHIIAILIRRGHPICTYTNIDKTHPKNIRAGLHAEMRTLKFARKGDTLIIMRFNKSGEICIAKPCDNCMKHIIDSGIKKIFYTNYNGIWEQQKL